MKVAILVGVSAYSGGLSPLKACDSDIEAIHGIVESLGKYDRILKLNGEVTSKQLKAELVKFLEELGSAEVEELLFYFTGHGSFNGDQFFYLLSDYAENRLNQTSLQNTELDQLIKSVSPGLTVKLVDACHSGAPYVKSEEVFGKHLTETKTEFRNVYFMFSSLSSEPSFQDTEMSFFTRSIVNSIVEFSGSRIRYKDVIDYISDDEALHKHQHPYFVVQADYTEEFGDIPTSIKEVVGYADDEHDGDEIEQEEPDGDGGITPDFMSFVMEDAERYCTEEEAREVLSDVIFKQLHEYKCGGEFGGLYETELHAVENVWSAPATNAIADWLHKEGRNCFIEINYTEEEYEIERPLSPAKMTSLMATFYQAATAVGQEPMQTIKKKRKVPTGIRQTATLPYHMLRFEAVPKYLNLPKATCYLLPIVSQTEIVLFYRFSKYYKVDWQKDKENKDGKWLLFDVPLKSTDIVRAHLDHIVAAFADFCLEEMKHEYDKTIA